MSLSDLPEHHDEYSFMADTSFLLSCIQRPDSPHGCMISIVGFIVCGDCAGLRFAAQRRASFEVVVDHGFNRFPTQHSESLKSGTERSAFFVSQNDDRRIANVCDHLSPGRAFGSAAGQHDFFARNPKLREAIDAVLESEGCAFSGGTHQLVRSGVCSVDPNQTALCTGKVGCALAPEERQGQHAVGPNRSTPDGSRAVQMRDLPLRGHPSRRPKLSGAECRGLIREPDSWFHDPIAVGFSRLPDTVRWKNLEITHSGDDTDIVAHALHDSLESPCFVSRIKCVCRYS